jgi:inhibitor of KinA
MGSNPDAAWQIRPLGDRCLIVEFGQRVAPEINAAARAFAEHLLAHSIPGVVDVVPAFTTVAIHYRPEAFAGAASPYRHLSDRVESMLAAGVGGTPAAGRLVEVPVCYGGDFGADLPEVAAACGMTTEEAIALHGLSPHVVYMLGFSPGFPYLGGLDPRLALPRRTTPRTRVPVGSVAIAREQTAIYSVEMPGGWNLIGRTPLRLFDVEADPPCLLQPGDRVRFVSISSQQFDEIAGSQRWAKREENEP